jgi:hypothetical protein
MAKPITETRAILGMLIEQLGRPDLATEQGRLDYRSLLLTQNALAIHDLPDHNPDAAVFLYHLVGERLRDLLSLNQLSEAQAKDLMGEVVGLYGRFRPELLPRLLTNAEPTETAPDAH